MTISNLITSANHSLYKDGRVTWSYFPIAIVVAQPSVLWSSTDHEGSIYREGWLAALVSTTSKTLVVSTKADNTKH